MLGKTSMILNMQKTCPKGLMCFKTSWGGHTSFETCLKCVRKDLYTLKHPWNMLRKITCFETCLKLKWFHDVKHGWNMSKRTYISSKTWLEGFSCIETHCQERLTCFETCWERLTCFEKYLKHVKDLYVSNMFGTFQSM